MATESPGGSVHNERSPYRLLLDKEQERRKVSMRYSVQGG